ncbi:PREDICTED: uncharacterized protein LOC106111948 [Papilio polytes]|uniref:uncharacterized protein LOC106111948 n=1 Tax=Papilio polytes TaxID=76194 RepID=UPI00067632B7|nr:PREDICTED: uncharacterized protein LOC106111948 [Papilio polytes]
MDLYDILLQTGLITSAFVLYLLFLRRPTKKTGPYRDKEWNYIIKYIFARIAVRRWKSRFPSKFVVSEKSKERLTEGWDGISIRASAPDGATVLFGIRKICGRKPMAEVTLYVKLADGTSYKLPCYSETLVVPWEGIEDGWSAGGLKIQILEPEQRLRILYNGLLTNSVDNTTQHVRINLIWCSATSVVRHPADWSDQLAAHALALDTWRDGSWTQILSKFGHNSWLQFGAVQGTLQTFEEEGILQRKERLRLRGVRERGWSRDTCPRRTLTLTAAAKDGTAIMLRGLSYKNIFNELISGFVRFPDYTIKPLTATDLVMSEFCETPEGIPKAYTITCVANGRSLKVVLRINDDDSKAISSAPLRQDIIYRTLAVEINGEHGTGILELTYESSDKTQILPQAPQTLLKWLSEDKAGAVGYCVTLEEVAAASPAHVGGKGASLALLASVQNDEGYKVPPGFCLTTKALERQLEVYPELVQAIQAIEAANEDYDESVFKQKCEIAVDLFMKTEISEDVEEEVLKYLNDLGIKIKEQNFSTEERFAVRSSGVCEDSEATSAAGQNATELGCARGGVLRAVRRCWASMFAFNSAYYRRQNGQPCACGGGVVVQALARARVAGVLFTRHPLGDPSTLLITANYGLGESVVSGSVEPDSIIVKRDPNGLRIAKIDLGSKKERVKPDGDGVTVELVSEEERKMPCLTVSEILKLAKIGVSQEELWGAGRDIEWAICDGEIYLLQARPITSLERWTEEELLHELDFPIMSDDELLTFANTGEVLPKPLTPLTYDLVITPLQRGIDSVIGCNGDHYDRSVALTHNRCALVLYNSVYRRMPPQIDVGIRMVEMAVHGHKVADERVLSTALHRRRPRLLDRALTMASMIKSVLFTKSTMNDTIKRVNELNLEMETSEPLQYVRGLRARLAQRMERFSANHSRTSSASTFTQFIAMSILLEGKEDFTPEHCSEIGVLLSSGDVVSAEVPLVLAEISRTLEQSGKVEEFRALQPAAAMLWLRRNLPHVHMDICQFLEQHGHRAIMEFDLATKPWALVPEEFIKVLQTMPTTKDENKTTRSNAEIIASLKTPQKPNTRKALRWVLPLCHRSVRHREQTKAHLILAIHKLRISILNLAKLLVRQWYLPHPDLVFFFRLNELQAYIEKRNPAILRKAIQRQQLYPSWCKLKFAEVNTGWVEALAAAPALPAGDVIIHATSVCGGEVVGRACVVKDLSEISELKSGDILITHSTDIGWSPYFPLLSGIVTELGGLISHGAVIAREYGLPCIVGATDATRAFATGDTVRLCASAGSLQRVYLQTDSVPLECLDCGL